MARAPTVPVGEGGPTRADAEGGDGGRVEAGNGSTATTPTEPPASLGEFLDMERRLFWRRRRCSRTGGCIHGRCLLVHHGRRVRVQRVYGRCLRFRHGWRLCVHRDTASSGRHPHICGRRLLASRSLRGTRPVRPSRQVTPTARPSRDSSLPLRPVSTRSRWPLLQVFSTRSAQHVPAQFVLCSSNKSTHKSCEFDPAI